MGGYYILKWFNKKEIPGVNAALPDGMSLEELASKREDEGDKRAAVHYQNGDAKHPSSPSSSSRTPSKPPSTSKDKDRDRDKNPLGSTVSKVPGGTKVTDTTKGIGVDISGDPAKAADVGKVAGKAADVGKAAGKTGDVGKLAGRVGDVGKVKDGVGGLLG